MTQEGEQKISEPTRLSLTVETSPEGCRLYDQELGVEAAGRNLTEAYKELLKRREKITGALDAAGIPYAAVVRGRPPSRSALRTGLIFGGVGTLFVAFLLFSYLALNHW